jgi:type I restriction enzyme S subunit
MVTKSGFRQTEIGEIPKDWDIKILDGLTEPERSIRYGIVQPGIFDINGRYLVRGQDYSFGWANPDTLFKVSSAIEEKYKNARLKQGDLLLTIVGANTGHLSTVPLWLDGANITQTTARIPIDKSKANSEYIKYYLQCENGQKLISNYIKGAAQPGLNIRDVRVLLVPLPPLPEQTAIATALSDMDALIAQTTALIEKKKAIKEGVIQELLRPKEGWVKRKLGEFGKTYGGIIGKSKNDFGHGNALYIPFMNIMSNPTINTNFLDRVNIKQSETQNRVRKGDLFFNGSSETPEEVGLCSVLTADVNNVFLNSFCFGFRMFNEFELNGIFIAYFFRSSFGRTLIYSLAQGATRYNLSKANLLKLELEMPCRKEQDRIVSILFELDAEINKQGKKLQKLKLQKQGMMQALLTGKIRLV